MRNLFVKCIYLMLSYVLDGMDHLQRCAERIAYNETNDTTQNTLVTWWTITGHAIFAGNILKLNHKMLVTIRKPRRNLPLKQRICAFACNISNKVVYNLSWNDGAVLFGARGDEGHPSEANRRGTR